MADTVGIVEMCSVFFITDREIFPRHEQGVHVDMANLHAGLPASQHPAPAGFPPGISPIDYLPIYVTLTKSEGGFPGHAYQS
jgi:hypothetical protein